MTDRRCARCEFQATLTLIAPDGKQVDVCDDCFSEQMDAWLRPPKVIRLDSRTEVPIIVEWHDARMYERTTAEALDALPAGQGDNDRRVTE